MRGVYIDNPHALIYSNLYWSATQVGFFRIKDQYLI